MFKAPASAAIWIAAILLAGQARADCLVLPSPAVTLSQGELPSQKTLLSEWCGSEHGQIYETSDASIRSRVVLPGNLRNLGGDDYYPNVARMQGHVGDALVAVVIDTNGDVLKVLVVRSSHHLELDHAAVKFYTHFHGDTVATLDGKPIRAIKYELVTFRLTR